MNQVALSRLAVYTDGVRNNHILAALHFLLEESSFEEVILLVKQHYELESVSEKSIPLFEFVKSSEDVLDVGLWQHFPEELRSFAYDAMLQSIARCSKRQICCLRITSQRGTLVPTLLSTFGRQFEPVPSLFIVTFVYNSRIMSFAVAATLKV